MAYYFPNLDETTRLNMIAELERDISNNLFYEPLSLNSYGLSLYSGILRISFEKGNCEALANYLQPNMFRMKNKNNNKVSSNISSMLAFNDFNRYYIRAMLVTVNNKKAKVIFAEPFATIEKLIRIAKQEIQANNFSELSVNIFAQKDHYTETIKKESEDSILNSSNCLLWWGLRGKARTF